MAFVLGLDGGIASVGWALIDDHPETGRIINAGSWCFDAPETDKERKTLNAIRREKRGQRRVIRRRRQRMAGLRQLFVQHGLLSEAGRDALRHRPGLDPWQLRADALQRLLTGAELAISLGHIARHRGFRSNSKRDQGQNAAAESSKMLKAVTETADRLGGRTIGQMAVTDPEWIERKRNRGDYARTVLRGDLEAEVRLIFGAQRRLGHADASEALQDAFEPLAFDQRPLGSSEDKVGGCSQESREKRTSKRAPSFEQFRLLARLRNLRLLTNAGPQALTPDQIALASTDFGLKARTTFKEVRKRLDLAPGVKFEGVGPDQEGDDIAARKNGSADGTAALRKALGEPGWRALMPYPEKLDRAAEIITFREDNTEIRQGLQEMGMEPWCADLLAVASEAGKFNDFRGAAHISAKAARNVLPGLRRGLAVDLAFAEAGYNHAATPVTSIDGVANPVARKALGQMLKQAKTVIHEYQHLFGASGLPDRIHVELARDVGKGQEERDEIKRGIEDRTKQRDRLRAELQDLMPGMRISGGDLQRFELWKEQNNTCLYSGSAIPLGDLMNGENRYEVDHILPWPRFGDDSFRNKTLASVGANRDKRGRTPFEWLGPDPVRWAEFTARVEGCRSMKGGKKGGHYLRRNATEVEEKFRTRNLNDTRYACRVFAQKMKELYGERGIDADSEEPERRRVFVRPGALTARLRQSWGLEGRKKGADGKRLADDRHHALDAIVVAACSESLLQRVTGQMKLEVAQGGVRLFSALDQPWPGFREAVHAKLDAVIPARPERRRVPGETHAATIKQVRERDGKVEVYERKSVLSLSLADLDRLNAAETRNAPLVAVLRAWIEAGKPPSAMPISPQGHLIRKVRLLTKDKVGVIVRGGTADRGDMARVDVFREDRPGRPSRYHLVPIYPHQVQDPAMKGPPMRAVVAHKEEADWTNISQFLFLFCLYPNSVVEFARQGDQAEMGYFRGMDRKTATIKLPTLINPTDDSRRPGTKTLSVLRKLYIDRLGNVSGSSGQEIRTWHGAVCI